MVRSATFFIILIFLFQGDDNRVLQELDMGMPQDAYLLGGLQSCTRHSTGGFIDFFPFLEQTSSVDKFKLQKFKYNLCGALWGA